MPRVRLTKLLAGFYWPFSAMAWPVAQARAGAYSYGGNQRIINVGIIMSDSAGQNQGNDLSAPYVFYVLNQRTDVCPGGWVLNNPLAPKTVTTTLLHRYPAQYALGQTVTPNMAVYWQVDITKLTTETMKSFDMLYIHTHKNCDFSQTERQAMRQFVNGGGTLWIDDDGGCIMGENATALSGVFAGAQFNEPGGVSGFGTFPNPVQRSPLVTTPYYLSLTEINEVGDKNIGSDFISSPFSAAAEPDLSLLIPAINNTAGGSAGLPYLAAGDYGGGHIVLSAGDIGDDINNYVAPNANEGPYCGTDFSAAHTEDLKLAVNVLSFAANSSSADQVNSRRSGYQSGSLSGALLPTWKFLPKTLPPTNAVYPGTASSTAIYGNIAFVSDVSGVLRAFDINPPESLNAAGTPDDGASGADPLTTIPYLSDYSAGYPFDELWAATVGGAAPLGPISSPVVGTIDTHSGPVVMVEDESGNVYVYDASSTGGTLLQKIAGKSGAGTFSGVPPTPAYYRGRLIADQPNGDTMLYDFNVGQGFDLYADAGTQHGGQSAVAPVIASVPSRDSIFGGEDIVAYVPTQSGVAAELLGSRDEHLSGSSNYVTKSGRLFGSPSLNVIGAPEDTVNNSNPTNWVYTLSNFYSFGGAYTNTPSDFPDFVQAGPAPQSANAITVTGSPSSVYADYDNLPVPSASIVRSMIVTPLAASATSPSSVPVVGMCVGPDGILYETVNEPTTDGSVTGYIEAIDEQNASPVSGANSSIKWRFALVGGVQDADGITYAFGGYQFVGAPIVDNGNVYALASNGVGNNAILAFNPGATCSAVVSGSIQPGQTVSITQTDEAGNTETILPTEYHFNPVTGVVNFTISASVGAAVPSQITPILGAPMPISASLAPVNQNGGNSGGVGTPQVLPITTSASGLPLLAWWTPVATGGHPSPLRKVGNTIYFSGGDGSMYVVNAAPTSLGIGINGSNRELSNTGAVLSSFQTDVGATSDAMAFSGNFGVIGGPLGIEGFGYQLLWSPTTTGSWRWIRAETPFGRWTAHSSRFSRVGPRPLPPLTRVLPACRDCTPPRRST